MPTIIHNEDREHFEIVCRSLADEHLHVAMVCPDALKLHDYANALQYWLYAASHTCVQTYDANRIEAFVADALLSRFEHALTALSGKSGSSSVHHGVHILLLRDASAMPIAEFRHMAKLVSERMCIVALFSGRDAVADQEKIRLLGSAMLRWDIDQHAPEPKKPATAIRPTLPMPAKMLTLSASAMLVALLLFTATDLLTAPEWSLQAFSHYPTNRTVIRGTVARAEVSAIPQLATEPVNGDPLPSR